MCLSAGPELPGSAVPAPLTGSCSQEKAGGWECLEPSFSPAWCINAVDYTAAELARGLSREPPGFSSLLFLPVLRGSENSLLQQAQAVFS